MTYQNAYAILRDVREMLGEYTLARLQGSDTSGAYSNEFLIRRINTAQRLLYTFLMKSIPDEFLAETTLTGSDSVFTLPWDCGRVLQFRDSDGNTVYPIPPRMRPTDASSGHKRLYYQKGRTLVLTRSGVSDTYTIFYRKKPREIHAGRAAAGGAASITLDADFAPATADYFNDMEVENVTRDWTDTISDYSAARVCTLSTETAAADDFYGIVSELPEPFHHLIAPRAVLEARLRHPHSKTPPSASEFQVWQQMCMQTLQTYGLGEDRLRPEDLWTDYSGATKHARTVNIPGQGYLIKDMF